MKKNMLLIFCLVAISLNSQNILLQENFQDWTAEPGLASAPPSTSPSGVDYTITKKLFDGKTDGTFTSNAIIVEPLKAIGSSGIAEGNGKPTKGRVALKGAKNYLELPKLPSVGTVKIKANVGTDSKEFKLQASTNGYFEDIPGTVTTCEKAVTKQYIFNLSFSTPTILRILPTSGSGVYIWDIEISSYSEK